MKKSSGILDYGIPLLNNTAKHLYSDAVMIIQKARLYNVSLFQNEQIINEMLTNSIEKYNIEEAELNDITDTIIWLNSIENNSQASK